MPEGDVQVRVELLTEEPFEGLVGDGGSVA